MAWGYEKCFVIEHDNTVKRRIDCKDCCYYESDDKSCMKRPLYLPIDGYNSRRTCDYFELDSSTSHYEEKKAQYEGVLRRKSNSVKTSSTTTKVKTNKKTVPKTDKSESEMTKTLPEMQKVGVKRKNYCVCEFDTKPKGLKLKYEYVEIVTATGGKKKIQVGFDEVTKMAYVNKKLYTPEAIQSIRKILQ